MITKPIIPIWLMIIILIVLFLVVIINKKRIITRSIILILLFMVNLRIMLPDGKAETVINNIDVLFVIDNSISMIAEDYKGNTRFSGVIANTEYIMDKLAGGSFALITFNNVSNIIAPFVDDPDITKNAIRDIKAKNSLYAKGTTLNVVYDDLKTMLTDIEDRDEKKVAVFFLSDGEITAEDKTLRSFADLKQYVDVGAVMGYGTTSGGKMKADDNYYYQDPSGYMLDRTAPYPYPLALSKINESNLKKIASDMGIKYVHMTKNTDIDNVLNELKDKVYKESDEAEEVYRDTYYIYAIILLFFLGVEFIYIRRNII